MSWWRAFRNLVIGVFLVSLILPTVQRLIDLFPRVVLTDVDTRVRTPVFGWKQFERGRFQKVAEDWLVRGSGLWGALVTANNSVNYWLFNVTSPGYRGVTTMGREKALFNTLSINDLNGRYFSDTAKMDTALQQIALLQSYLTSQGIPFLLVVSPNKAVLYPEWVRSTQYSVQPRARLMDSFRRRVQEVGIHHLILSDELLTDQRYQGMRFFPKSGAHMNRLGTCIAARAIARAINVQRPGSVREIECGEVTGMEEPSGDDRDLARIINVASYRASLDRQPIVKPKVLGEQTLADTLFVGTSNLFGMIGTLRDLGAIDQRDYYFYSRNLYSCRRRAGEEENQCLRRPINKKSDYPLTMLAGRSAVILETPEARVHQIGFGFLERIAPQIENKG